MLLSPRDAGPSPTRVADTAARIHACGLVPVVVLPRAEVALPLAETLMEAGISVVEFTFRTAAAPAAIAAVRSAQPEMLVFATDQVIWVPGNGCHQTSQDQAVGAVPQQQLARPNGSRMSHFYGRTAVPSCANDLMDPKRRGIAQP